MRADSSHSQHQSATQPPVAGPPRIGIVIGSLEWGGAERMALALVRALIGSGAEVRLFCLDGDREMPIPGDEHERSAIERSIVVLGSSSSRRNTARKALAFPGLRRRLEREVRAANLDLVISFMERANILNLLGRPSVPRIVSIRKHLTMALSDKTPLKRALVKTGYRWLMRRAANINFNAAEAAADFRALFPGVGVPMSVIANFIDDDIQRRARQSPAADARALRGRRVLLTCGRLMPVKGHMALLRAFAPIAAETDNAHLVILGEGPSRGALEAARTELGLEGRVHLPGFQDNPYSWIAACTAFVLSSRAEGFPNALVEAMALGKPVLSTDCPSGPRELLAPDTAPQSKTRTLERAPFGILTPPLDPSDHAVGSALSEAEASLSDGLRMLLDDASLRDAYGRKARQRVVAFRRKSVLRQWHDLMEQYIPHSDWRRHPVA